MFLRNARDLSDVIDRGHAERPARRFFDIENLDTSCDGSKCLVDGTDTDEQPRTSRRRFSAFPPDRSANVTQSSERSFRFPFEHDEVAVGQIG